MIFIRKGMQMSNIHLNFLQTGHPLTADEMIVLYKIYCKTKTSTEFLCQVVDSMKLDVAHAMLVWQSFDVMEGSLIHPSNLDGDMG